MRSGILILAGQMKEQALQPMQLAAESFLKPSSSPRRIALSMLTGIRSIGQTPQQRPQRMQALSSVSLA